MLCYVCMYVYMSICLYVCMYLCIFVSLYLCVFVSLYLCIYVCVCMYNTIQYNTRQDKTIHYIHTYIYLYMSSKFLWLHVKHPKSFRFQSWAGSIFRRTQKNIKGDTNGSEAHVPCHLHSSAWETQPGGFRRLKEGESLGLTSTTKETNCLELFHFFLIVRIIGALMVVFMVVFMWENHRWCLSQANFWGTLLKQDSIMATKSTKT